MQKYQYYSPLIDIMDLLHLFGLITIKLENLVLDDKPLTESSVKSYEKIMKLSIKDLFRR